MYVGHPFNLRFLKQMSKVEMWQLNWKVHWAEYRGSWVLHWAECRVSWMLGLDLLQMYLAPDYSLLMYQMLMISMISHGDNHCEHDNGIHGFIL